MQSKCGYFKDKSLFVELPCKVGDEVYVITEKHPCYACKVCADWCHKDCRFKNKTEMTVKKAKAFSFYIQDTYLDFRVEIEETKHLQMHFLTYRLGDFGKTVFLTKEEAEEKLKEIEKTE